MDQRIKKISQLQPIVIQKLSVYFSYFSLSVFFEGHGFDSEPCAVGDGVLGKWGHEREAENMLIMKQCNTGQQEKADILNFVKLVLGI